MVKSVPVFSIVSGVMLGLAAFAPPAQAQSRAECEAGLAFIRTAQAQPQDPARRATLDTAWRKGQRELGEGNYGECLEAADEARAALESGSMAALAQIEAPSSPAEDERVVVDQDFPVSTEGAGLPDRGEVEVRVLAGYNRLRKPRSTATGGEDEDGGSPRRGRDLTMPAIEAEFGLGHGLSASLGLAYAFGNAEEARTGEAEFGLKWNFLPAQGLRPALTLLGGGSVPFGPRHGPSETVLGLLAQQPLARGRDAPVLHGNILWFHALDREEDERRDRYAVSVAVAVPVTRQTGAFLGYAREQDFERGRADQFIEIGGRQLLPNDMVLAVGVGIGIGDSEADFRVLAGLQKNF